MVGLLCRCVARGRVEGVGALQAARTTVVQLVNSKGTESQAAFSRRAGKIRQQQQKLSTIATTHHRPLRHLRIHAERPQPLARQRRGLSQTTSSAWGETSGKFVPLNDTDTPYRPGQFFIHDRLGYRGVITAAWKAAVYTFDTSSIGPLIEDEDSHQPVMSAAISENRVHDGHGVLLGVKRHKFQLTDVSMKLLKAVPDDIVCYNVPVTKSYQHWYQVMADRRDYASDIRTNIACRNISISPINLEYIDYVSHNHILPFTPAEPQLDNNFLRLLFQNELTDEEHPVAVPKALHARWLISAAQDLKTKDIYETRAHGITVRAIPFYAFKGNYCHNWHYKIMLDSENDAEVSLVQRLWVTQDSHGQVDLIIGRGVVGYEPKLSPTNPFFSYSSRTFLDTQDGLMGGFYTFIEEKEAGRIIHIPTPTFSLNKPPPSRTKEELVSSADLLQEVQESLEDQRQQQQQQQQSPPDTTSSSSRSPREAEPESLNSSSPSLSDEHCEPGSSSFSSAPPENKHSNAESGNSGQDPLQRT